MHIQYAFFISVDSLSPYKNEAGELVPPVFRWDLILLYCLLLFMRGGGTGRWPMMATPKSSNDEQINKNLQLTRTRHSNEANDNYLHFDSKRL